ncbi:MAG: hypothetical protein WD738_08685 [Pirellulales bacterium]
MNTLTHKTVLTLFASLTLVIFAAVPAAAQSRLVLVAPESDPGFAPDYCLPQFGFSSFNIHGVGERVTFVRWGGLASQLGLEPGDMILSMNGYPLSYHGAWNDALSQAVYNGGWVQLRIRDVRTGVLAYRESYVGGSGPIVGPITPRIHVGGYHPPVVHHRRHVGYPGGPITAKSTYHGRGHDLNKSIKEIANLFD